VSHDKGKDLSCRLADSRRLCFRIDSCPIIVLPKNFQPKEGVPLTDDLVVGKHISSGLQVRPSNLLDQSVREIGRGAGPSRLCRRFPPQNRNQIIVDDNNDNDNNHNHNNNNNNNNNNTMTMIILMIIIMIIFLLF
jgi:hypothetical protein